MIPKKPGTKSKGVSGFLWLDQNKARFEQIYRRLALRQTAADLIVSVNLLTRWMDSRGYRRRDKRQAANQRAKRLGKADQVVYLRLFESCSMEDIRERLKYRSKGTVHSILAYRGLDGDVSGISEEKIRYWAKHLGVNYRGRDAEEKPPPAEPGAQETEEGGSDPDPA